MFKKLVPSQKVIIISVSVVMFILGFSIRPTVDFYKDLFAGYFAPKVYVAPLGEYEQQTLDLYNSKAHQATCKANAAAVVSLELANKYLTETKKQQIVAVYAIPDSLIDSINKNPSAFTSSKKK